ncbi:MAG TPA: hypothetical protein VER55_09220, partial [Ardenticatenaceae bacterium]|nr:hypothetical protein [Ardenticatenaceae bacterium]
MARQASADAAAAGEPRPVPAGASQRPFRLPVFDIVGLVLLAVSGATLLALLGLGPGLLSGGLAALLRRLFG